MRAGVHRRKMPPYVRKQNNTPTQTNELRAVKIEKSAFSQCGIICCPPLPGAGDDEVSVGRLGGIRVIFLNKNVYY